MANFRFLVLVSLLSFFYSSLWAKRVDLENAEKVARHHVESKKRQLRDKSRILLKYASFKDHNRKQLRQQNILDSDTVCYYVFNVNSDEYNGFVIVSGDDAAKPILGYSDNGSYDENNLAPAFVCWMECLQQDIIYAIENNLPQSEKARIEWDAYLDANSSHSDWRENNVIVPHLIQTQWNQTAPYNDLCPPGTPTGCVATVMAQLMKFHEHPKQGNGESNPYNTTSNLIPIPSVSFEVEYAWDKMLNTYSGITSPEEKEAVATLMYHCGVSVKMDYKAGGSGASTKEAAHSLIKYFDYDASIQSAERVYYDNVTWEALLRQQMDKGLPVIYSGRNSQGGHAFICDGYAENGYFHFNWGWSGSQDGYYLTTGLEPGTGGTGSGSGTYNQDQYLIFNIMPNDGGTASPVLKLYKDMSSPTQSIDRNKTFSVSTSLINVGIGAFTGNIGIALVDDDDSILGVIGTYGLSISNLITDSGYPNISINCSVSASIDPGYYQLRTVARLSGESWEIVTGEIGMTDKLEIEVRGGLKLYNNISSTTISVDKEEVFTVDAYAINTFTKSFSGYLGVALTDNNNRILEIIETTEPTTYNLNQNVSLPLIAITSTISCDVPEGDYKLWVVAKETSSDNWNLLYGTTSSITDHLEIEVKNSIANTVTFDAQEGSDVEPQSVTKCNPLTNPTTIYDGYDFGGWFKDADCTDEWIFGSDIVTQDTTLYAKWGLHTNIPNNENLVFKIYPNPVRQGEKLHITLPEKLIDGVLYIYDVNGSFKKRKTLPETTVHTIGTADLSSGVWLFHFVDKDNNWQIMKVVIN